MTQRPSRTAGFGLEAAAKRADLPVRRVRRYVRIGLIQPFDAEAEGPLFDDVGVARLRRIRRLSDDLGLDSNAIEIVLRLIDQIEALQRDRDTWPAGHTSEASRWQ